jgi:glycosyltransferase involved in cell wall biosynthesis
MVPDAMTRAGSPGVPARSRGTADAGLSIVVPLFNEAANLSSLHARLVEAAGALKATRGLTTEVVYVDDGSRDGTLAVARELPADNLDVQVLSLSRNFGKEAALLAGLDHARLGAVLFMDGDGQHPPTLIDSSRAIGSTKATTSSTPPRHTAKASRGCAGSGSRGSTA